MRFSQSSSWLKLRWSYTIAIILHYTSSLNSRDLDADFCRSSINRILEQFDGHAIDRGNRNRRLDLSNDLRRKRCDGT